MHDVRPRSRAFPLHSYGISVFAVVLRQLLRHKSAVCSAICSMQAHELAHTKLIINLRQVTAARLRLVLTTLRNKQNVPSLQFLLINKIKRNFRFLYVPNVFLRTSSRLILIGTS